MTDKEKIRKFLEGMANADCCNHQVAKTIEKIILPYIDSLQEEPVSEDLEAEIHNKIMMLHTAPCYDELADFARHFASWQKKIDNRYANLGLVEQIRLQQKCYEKGMADMKQQIMKDAIEGYVDMLEFPDKTWIELSAIPKDLKDGDKVKLTIIKED